jgi:hypothetical protein
LLLDTFDSEKQLLNDSSDDIIEILNCILKYNDNDISIALHLFIETVSNSKENI